MSSGPTEHHRDTAGAGRNAGLSEPSALVAGESLVDVVRGGGRPQREHPGGSPANVALGLARLGHRVQLSTWFAGDAHGALLREHLTRAGVHLTQGSDHAGRTSIAVAELDEHGGARYTFDLEWRLPPTRVNERVQVLHTGSIAATAAPGADDVAHLLRAGASQATISYDPNARPSIMGEPGAVRERVETLVRSADVVKVADEDLIWLYPGQDPMVPARTWANAGPAFVVVTCGGEPAAGLLGDEVVLVPSPQVQVVDTVGAGDSYMAALLDALWQADLLGSERREGLHRIGVSRLREAMHRAATAAAITVGRPGADLPTRADLDRALHDSAGERGAGHLREHR